eukprot:2045087-Pleurochrysis_carterae.AAC.5
MRQLHWTKVKTLLHRHQRAPVRALGRSLYYAHSHMNVYVNLRVACPCCNRVLLQSNVFKPRKLSFEASNLCRLHLTKRRQAVTSLGVCLSHPLTHDRVRSRAFTISRGSGVRKRSEKENEVAPRAHGCVSTTFNPRLP